MSRFLAANTKYHTTHKTKGSDAQIAEAHRAVSKKETGKELKRVSASPTVAAKPQFCLLNPETGRCVWFATQADMNQAAVWFDLYKQDQQAAKLLAAQRRAVALEQTEGARVQKLIDSAPLVIERVMVGAIAAMEGIRCYHYDKRAYPAVTDCDCTKVADGVFVVSDRHQPGTFYLDERKVKRQILIMKASEADGKVNCSNPGGYGQPISIDNHIRLAVAARFLLDSKQA